jgi:hypothetical protein
MPALTHCDRTIEISSHPTIILSDDLETLRNSPGRSAFVFAVQQSRYKSFHIFNTPLTEVAAMRSAGQQNEQGDDFIEKVTGISARRRFVKYGEMLTVDLILTYTFG